MANLNIDLKDFSKSEKYIELGIEHSKKIENLRLLNFFKLARAKLHLKRDDSLQYFDELKAVQNFASEKEYKFLHSASSEVLKEMYLHKGDYQNAYIISEKLMTEKDSINSKKIEKESAFLDSKLKYEALQNSEKLTAQKSQFSKKLLYAISLFSVLMILMFSYFVKRLKTSYNILKQKNELLEKQDAELTQSSQELEIRNQKLKLYIESNTQLEKFARTTSHDIKTPLRTIASFAGLLRKNILPKLNEKEQGYLSHIIDGTKRLSSITNDLLNSSANGNILSLEKFNVRELIDNNIRDLAFLIQQTNTVFHIGEMPMELKADKIKFRRVMQNLIENAIKYSSPDRSPEIYINCVEKEKLFEFSVSDNGIGIDPKNYDQVFRKFSRVDNQGKIQGVGLGLSICKNNIEKHGGQLWINPDYKDGTEFCFTIPKQSQDIELASKMPHLQ